MKSQAKYPASSSAWAAFAPLARSFYQGDPRQVARQLLGKLLLRGSASGALRTGRIVETEAYLGADDAAAHAAAGPTLRNQVLFGPPGHAYVYLSYGLHYCLNVSCMPPGDAGCVLVRAIEPLAGIPAMAHSRGLALPANEGDREFLKKLASGPARLCQALDITRARDNGKDMTSKKFGLWIADDNFRPRQISTSPRIGITKSPELPLRYFIAGSPFVSGKK